MNLRTLTLLAVAAATIGLSGCVVVPARGYGGYGGYGGPGYAVEPAPVAVYPAPYPYYGGYGGGGYVQFGGRWHR
ncbi:hypothetical protein ACFQAT_24420 [Undibacterium arcticum]|uniref:Lipoprotein n=1 Tax=Undibacterium arcticum TaxID=1762892 RepID=A0ABV7FAX5_9BURK